MYKQINVIELPCSARVQKEALPVVTWAATLRQLGGEGSCWPMNSKMAGDRRIFFFSGPLEIKTGALP